MGKRKGFPSPGPDLSQPIVIEQLDPVATTEGRLEQLLVEIKKHRLSPRCFGLMKRYAQMPPAVRLSVNIKSVVDKLSTGDIQNVLLDGLSQHERDVLEELSVAGVSRDAQRTAHSLLNIDVRANVVAALRRTFKDMRSRRRHTLKDKPLDK
jgi:hypothetical protein